MADDDADDAQTGVKKVQDNRDSKRQMILVLGAHRSGTSVLSGMLSHLGVDFSDWLIPPGPDNPKGFFEHEEIWQLDHDLLHVLGSDWDDPGPLPKDWQGWAETHDTQARLRAILKRDYARSPLVGIKDPRMCRLMPLWRPLVEQEGFALKVILALRPPAQVAASLQKRDGTDLQQGAGMWLRYTLEAEAATRGLPRAVVSYEALIDDWRTQANHVATALDLSWPRPVDTAADQIDMFIEPGLRHQRHAPDTSDIAQPQRDWLQRAWTALTATSPETPALDAVVAEIAEADTASSAYIHALRGMHRFNARLQKHLLWHADELASIANSNAELTSSATHHETRSRQLEDQLRLNADHVANLERESSRLQQTVAALNHTLRARADDRAEAQKELKLSAEHAANLSARITSLEGQLRQHTDAETQLRTELQQLRTELQQQVEICTSQEQKLHRQAVKVEGLITELSMVYHSRSWRMTRLIRALMRRLRRLTGRGSTPQA